MGIPAKRSIIAIGIAEANRRTPSANSRVTIKVELVIFLILLPKRSPRNWYAVDSWPLKYLGRKKKLTTVLPRIYPKVICKNVKLPPYATAGILIKVSVLVSVATTENSTAHHGSLWPPRK
jgi:hypothetical protein